MSEAKKAREMSHLNKQLNKFLQGYDKKDL